MATKKKAAKRRPYNPLINGEALMDAVAAYVEQHGGTVVVSGPISLMQFPGDRQYTYHVAVKCTGVMPTAPGRVR